MECRSLLLRLTGKPDLRTFGFAAEWEYGPRAGMPKLMRLFEKYDTSTIES